MIPIYIASSDRFACCEPVIQCSIEQNTNEETHIQFIRPDTLGLPETGCTGFTNLRFTVPELLRRDGYDFGIYLDVDMLLLGDIAELFAYRMTERFVCLMDGSTEVAVISAAIRTPPMAEVCQRHKSYLDGMMPKSRKIPWSWNVEDRFDPEAKLIHFTDLKCQPWFYDNHPDADAVALWEHYANLAEPV